MGSEHLQGGQLGPRQEEGALSQEGSRKNECISPEKTEDRRGVLWEAVCYIHEQTELDPRKGEVGQGIPLGLRQMEIAVQGKGKASKMKPGEVSWGGGG